MQVSTKITLWIVLLSSIAQCLTETCHGDDAFSTKILNGWKEYLQSTRPLTGSFVSRNRLKQSPEKSFLYEIKVRRQDGYKMFIEELGAKVSNEDYSFELSRSTPGGNDWYLTSLEQRTDQPSDSYIGFLKQIDRRITTSYPSLGISNIAKLTNSTNEFEMTFVQTGADGNIVDVAFECTGLQDDGARRLQQKGTAKLDKANFFLPVQFEVTFELNGLEEGATTCSGNSKGTNEITVFDKAVVTRIAAIDNFESENIVFIKDVTLKERGGTAAKKEFRLPAFGIPEPDFVKPGYNWQVIVGIGGLILILLCVYLKKRN